MKTNIVDILKPEYVKIDMQANIRDEAIKELINIEAAQDNLKDKELLLRDILYRESQFTTNLMDFIAIPHAKSLAVKNAMVLIGKSKAGIDWRPNADAESSNYEDRVLITFLILVPANAEGNDHLKILAMLARCLAKKEFRQTLINENDPTKLSDYMVKEVSAKMSKK